MGQQAILHFRGQLATGFQVTLNIRDQQGQDLSETHGTLPPAPQLVQSIIQWQECYRQSVKSSRIGPVEVEVKPGTIAEQASCRQAGETLQKQLTTWLNAPGFLPIDQCLRETFTHQDDIRVLLRSHELFLHRLPWHCWDFIDHYPFAELTFGSLPHRITAQSMARRAKGKVRILAILGDRRQINTEVDRQLWEALPDTEITFLVEPSRQQMDAQLWEQQSWDILFFAGHSASDADQGVIYLNPQDCLTLKELRFGLRRAIRRGLQLAIFNSCDGLGLAYALESLHLPQLIVMREPVADRVAQDFLQYFLTAFSQGESLPLALRQARERLQSLEHQFLWATWLPVLFQNPAAIAPTWQSLKVPPVEPRRSHWQAWLRTAALGTGFALALGIGRYYGGLQTLELAVFDHFTRSRPSERQDDRIVVVEVTDTDIEAQLLSERGEGRSISNQTLDQVFEILEDDYQPAVIGLDIYRDLPSEIPSLAAQYANNETLITVCKGRDSRRGIDGVAPPAEVPPDRLGLSDTPSDRDGVVRRQLLSSESQPNSPCTTDYTLSTAIASRYLAAQGMELTFPKAQTWQWDQTQFHPIDASTTWLNIHPTYARYGPYAPLNIQGNQILLNYRVYGGEPGQPKNPTHAFLHVTLQELLDKQVNVESLKDKIVLIGVNARSSEDFWQTPYRTATGEPLVVPGVYLQAQMTSQLLSTVLDGRSQLHCLPWLIEGVIMLGLGATTAVVVRGRWGWVNFAIALPCFYGLSWVAFISTGLCLPLVPWSLASLGGGLIGQLDKRLN